MSGAVIMKMISSTSMTSTIGVTLISELRSPPPPVLIAIASPQEVPLDDVEVVLLERLHLRAQDADPAREVVERHDRRDRGDEPHRGREQRLGDVRADGLERGRRRLLGIGDVEEREQNAD